MPHAPSSAARSVAALALATALLAASCRSTGSDESATLPEPLLPHMSLVVESMVLGETRIVHVWTPPSYDADASASLPVLYMPDGGVEEDFVHVTNDMDSLIRQGIVRPTIVVGLENTERRRDMTGPTRFDEDREIAPRVGGSQAFRDFWRTELIPTVERRFRTNGERAIVGESLAGLFVLETFFLEPDLFDTWIALSPSLWWNGGALVEGAEALLGASPSLNETVYFATASDDDVDGAGGKLAAAFENADLASTRWIYEACGNLTHATIYRERSPDVFRALFGADER
ncbi:MAG: alpha/beta hydrolase-fold protein [Planctomycetota bacterium]